MKFWSRVYAAIRFVLQVRSDLSVGDGDRVVDADHHRVGFAGNPALDVPVVAPPVGVTFSGEVVDIIDGDTVEIETRVRHRIRLLDCWCKETTLRNGTTPDEKIQGLAAKSYLQALLKRCGNRVVVHIPGNGGNLSKLTTLSRVLGRMWRNFGNDLAKDPTDISGLMVNAGHATKTKAGA